MRSTVRESIPKIFSNICGEDDGMFTMTPSIPFHDLIHLPIYLAMIVPDWFGIVTNSNIAVFSQSVLSERVSCGVP